MRTLAVDPGEKHIGLALSDPSGIVARPLTTLKHEAREKDAARIAALAVAHQADMILVGLALDASGAVGPQARRAERLVEALRALTALPVTTYDESFSTEAARRALLTGGRKRRARREQIHAAAAAALLQSYLDAHSSE